MDAPPRLPRAPPAGGDARPASGRGRRASRPLARRCSIASRCTGTRSSRRRSFEFAEVLERGLGTLDPADVLRFVEPESGEVAALRPDMTPADRAHGRHAAAGSAAAVSPRVRGHGPAPAQRTRAQAPADPSGWASSSRASPAPRGTSSSSRSLVDALRAAGLERFTIDVGDAGVVRALLRATCPAEQARALRRRSRARTTPRSPTRATRSAASHADALRALPWLHGGRDALVEGVAAPGEDARCGRRDAAARALRCGRGRGSRRASARPISARCAASRTTPARSSTRTRRARATRVVSGGRYDELLARFGWPMPAAGFALDLDRAGRGAAARRDVGRERPPGRVVVVGPADDRAPRRAARARRSRRSRIADARRGAAMGARVGIHARARRVRLGRRDHRRLRIPAPRASSNSGG